MNNNNYSYPHDTYTMVDNTKLKIDDVLNNSDPVLLQPFFSSKGEDGKIIKFTNYKNTREEYGEPDIDVYGQGYYHVLNWLEGQGYVEGIRLTAKNATYANSVLILDIKTSKTQKTTPEGDPLYATPDGEETTISSGNSAIMITTAIAKFRIISFKKMASDKEDIKALMRTQFNEDEDGKHIPLLCFIAKGKGTYGGMYRWRISPNIQKDKNSKYRNFNLELYKLDTKLDPDPLTPISVSTLPSARNIARQSEYIEDVASRSELSVRVYGLEDGIQEAYDTIYNIVKQENPDVEKDQIDILTFYDTDLNKYKYITLDGSSSDITKYEGHPLKNGSDGDFDITNPNRDDAMNERLEDFFNGYIDASVSDVEEHVIDISLDANYPLEAKKAMITWRNLRDDHRCIIDSSFMFNVPSLKGWIKDEFEEHDFPVTLQTQNFETFDKYTGKYIRVTATYLYSLLYPSFIKRSGTQTPFAGLDVPLDAYIREGSLRPVIATPEDKNDIYELGGNYICREAGHYVFGSNRTTQEYESELKYTNNVSVYYEIKRDLISLSSQFRFKFSGDDTDDIKTLNNIANSKISKYQDVKCKKIEVSVSKDPGDPTGKSLITECNVGFKDFALNNNIKVNINRY